MSILTATRFLAARSVATRSVAGRFAAGIAAAGVAATLTVLPAAAQSPEALAHETIAGQIEAFRAQDGERAYSFAAPGVKRYFRSPNAFMAMVERGYKPVYAPRDYTFGRFGERDGNALQEVLITGPKGREWAALYTLEEQEDGSMLITSVRLAPSSAEAI